jgi:hypothetical protein
MVRWPDADFTTRYRTTSGFSRLMSRVGLPVRDGVDISSEYLADVTAQRFGAGVQMELTGA